MCLVYLRGNLAYTHLAMHRVVRRTTLISLGCASFLTGLGLKKIGLELLGWPWLVLAGVLVLLCGRKQLLLAVPEVIAAGLLCGLWRGTEVQLARADYGQFMGAKVVVQGAVVEDPT